MSRYEEYCKTAGYAALPLSVWAEEVAGTLVASDERIAAAGKRVGIEFGCDTADHMADRIEALTAERDRLRAVCGEAYQLAGAVGAPLRVLDNLSAAADGRFPLPHPTMLPVSPDECSEVAEAKRDGERQARSGR